MNVPAGVLSGRIGDRGACTAPGFLNMLATSKSVRVFPLIAAGSVIFLLYLSVKRPYFFGESYVLALLVLVIAGLIASQYETHFWTLMIGVFFWAGSALPLAGSMN